MITVKSNLKEETTQENGGREASSCGVQLFPRDRILQPTAKVGRALPSILSEELSVGVRLSAG